jgi:RNA-directed DNA polymerase
MKTYKNLYSEIYDIDNLMKAWRKARKGKTKKEYVIEFEKDVIGNLFKLQKELIELTYEPKPLKVFVIRDPKTRKIAKSAFRDRVIHHALVLVIEPIFDKIFIYDSCANRKGKGNLFALKRFDEFKRKVSSNGKIVPNELNNNNYVKGYCFKADIKHYFQEVDHDVLISLIKNKIKDEKVLWLINKILKNRAIGGGGSDFSLGACPLEI